MRVARETIPTWATHGSLTHPHRIVNSSDIGASAKEDLINPMVSRSDGRSSTFDSDSDPDLDGCSRLRIEQPQGSVRLRVGLIFGTDQMANDRIQNLAHCRRMRTVRFTWNRWILYL